MKTSDFDYSLPPELIAQTPIEPRDQSRLMILNRSDGSTEHRKFIDLADYLRAGDVLLFNDSRVIPARLNGRKIDSGGKVEILLLRRLDTCAWETLVRPGKRVNIGTTIEIKRDSTISRLQSELDTFKIQAQAGPNSANSMNPNIALRIKELESMIDDLNKQNIQQRLELTQLRKRQ